MSNERRDRYAAAIYDAGDEYWEMAEAAMAVADAEIARVEVRRQEVVHALNNLAYEHGREIGRAVEAESIVGRVRRALAGDTD